MKIVCYINKLSNGGAERVLSVLANALVSRGHQVDMVLDYEMDNEYALDDRIRRIVLDGRFDKDNRGNAIKRTMRRIFLLRKHCTREKADIVISFMKEANQRALLATMFTKTKNLISIRIDPKRAYHSCIERLFVRLMYRGTDGCVFQTEEAKSWYPRTVQAKSQVILNPLSLDFYKQEIAETRTKRIVTCGRLTRQKNHELLLRAFAGLNTRFADYSLCIYGEGPEKDSIRQKIAEMGLENRVTLAGRIADVQEQIKEDALFVLSSDYEGLPNALMEAMALGLPVISTDCSGGGARILIRDGENGRLVPCGDAAALTQVMENMLDDQASARRMAAQAYEDAQGYQAEIVVSRWEKYILELCGR